MVYPSGRFPKYLPRLHRTDIVILKCMNCKKPIQRTVRHIRHQLNKNRKLMCQECAKLIYSKGCEGLVKLYIARRALSYRNNK